jgi:DNA-binding NarL/FixJ family response regulator
MLAEGLGNKEIARQLDISDNTVKFHLSSIFGKLGATNRTEAVMFGMRHGFIMV